MTERQLVEQSVAKLQELAWTKQMSLMLYAEDSDKGGFDIGAERLIVLTRIKLRSVGKLADSEMASQLIEMMQGKEPNKLKALTVADPMVEQLEKDLEEVDGIRTVKISKYEVHVEKTRMFTWEEIVPKVLGILEEFGLKREFDKSGITGVVQGNA